MINRNLTRFVVWSFALALLSVWSNSPAVAQFGRNSAVGGVKIDAQGFVQTAAAADFAQELQEIRQRVGAPPAGTEPSGMRMISLKRLQRAIQESMEKDGALSPEIMYLAGLQRVQYVFVYPEEQDIVIGGPAESWTVRDRDAAIVGVQSQLPVVQLEDLLVAFQSVNTARDGISCSIEPTAEGSQRLTAFLKQLPTNVQPSQIETQMKTVFGPQLVKLTGVATDSHFARILLAADYQMKRISMDLAESNIEGLPSYIKLSKNQTRSGNSNPRFWMACNYDSLRRTPDRMAWSISGQGVKTLSETDISNTDGTRTGSGKSDGMAKQWADLMTRHFNALAKEHAVFGQLRNVMDLSVLAALVLSENLDQTSGCDLGVLLGKTLELQTGGHPVPEKIAPQCSFVRGSRGWVVSASGGVQLDLGSVISRQQEGSIPGSSKPSDKNHWWWNG